MPSLDIIQITKLWALSTGKPNRLECLNLSRNSMPRLNDMTIAVYHGETTRERERERERERGKVKQQHHI